MVPRAGPASSNPFGYAKIQLSAHRGKHGLGAANEGDLKKESGAPEQESLSCSRGNGIGTRIYGRLVVSHIRQRMAAYGTLPDSLWNLLHVNVLS